MRKRLFMIVMAGLVLAGCGGSAGQQNAVTGDTGKDSVSGETGGTSDGEEDVANTEQPYVFEFTDALMVDGGAMSSDIFENSRLTMVNVWATFCGPCINEMPDLGEISKEYDQSDFQIIGIVSDAIEGDEKMLKEAKDIIEETGADYPHLLLNEELYINLVGASDSVPTTYFFNEDGELLGYLLGAQSKEVWEEIIDGLLEEVEK